MRKIFPLVFGVFIGLWGMSAVAQVLSPLPEPLSKEQGVVGPEAGNPTETTLDIQQLLDQARSAAERGEIDAAITTLQALISHRPDHPRLPEAYLGLGELFLEKARHQRAIEAFRKILESYPSSPYVTIARFRLAHAYLAGQDPARAVALFDGVRGQVEEKLEIYHKGAEVYFGRAEFVGAIELLQKELALVPAPEAGSVRSLIERIVKERLAEKDLLALVEKYPKGFPGDEATVRLIEYYFANAAYYKAERQIKRLTSSFPRHAFTSRARELLEEMKRRLGASRHRLAVFLPLSGNLAPFGHSALNAIRLALTELGDQKDMISLVIKDTEEEKGRLKEALKGVIENYRPLAVIGPMLSREVDQLAPLVQELKIPLVTPGASALDLTQGRPYVFRNALTSLAQARALTTYAAANLPDKRFVILYPREAYGEELMRAFRAEVQHVGGEVIDLQSYNPDQTDFGPQVRRIRETDLKKYGSWEPVEVSDLFEEVTTSLEAPPDPAGKEALPEYVYTPGFDAVFVVGEARAIGLILPQLAFYGIENIPLLGNSGWNSGALVRLAGRFAEGSVFAEGFFRDSSDQTVRDFVSKYRRAYQEDPDLFSAQAYDVARWVIRSIQNGYDTPEKVREGLLALQNVSGVSGLARFYPDGEPEKKVFLIQIRSGKFEQVN